MSKITAKYLLDHDSEKSGGVGLNAETAERVAQALGGEAWQSGGEIWLVLIRRKDGHLVVLSEDAVCEYRSEEAFERNKASVTIILG